MRFLSNSLLLTLPLATFACGDGTTVPTEATGGTATSGEDEGSGGSTAETEGSSGGADQGTGGGSPGAAGNGTGGTESGGAPASGGASTGGDAGGGIGGVLGGSGGGIDPFEPQDCDPELVGLFRDFKGAGEPGGHIDFELTSVYPAGGNNWPSQYYGEPAPGSSAYRGLNEIGCGLVSATLSEGKPTFMSGLGLQRELAPARNPLNNPPVTQSVVGCVDWNWNWTPPNVISNADSFSSWFNTDPAFNIEVEGALALVSGVHDNPAFFPLDGQGWDNTPGWDHNYHFTFEHHSTFEYLPDAGQTFSFRGNDDLWIYVNGVLALDLGGMHEPMEGTINLDASRATLGINGGSVSLDLYYAQRQTPHSEFKIETNISCFKNRPQ